MKRILFLLALCICFAGIARADRHIPIGKEQLPNAASIFIEQNFPTAQISQIIQELDTRKKNYTVWLDNGIIIEFDKNGAWKEIHSNGSTPIPEIIIPTPISSYVTQYFPSNKIIEIEKEKKGKYNVELNDGTEILFDRNFQVLDIDD